MADIQFDLQPVQRRLSLDERTDVGSGFAGVGAGLVTFGRGLNAYLKAAEQDASDADALQLKQDAEAEIDEGFRNIDTTVEDPRQAAKQKRDLLLDVQRRSYQEASKRGLNKSFNRVATKFYENVHTGIFTAAQQREGIYADGNLSRAVEDFAGLFAQQVENGIVSIDQKSGMMALEFDADSARELAANEAPLLKAIQRGLQAMKPEDVLKRVDHINDRVLDSYAKTLALNIPSGSMHQTIRNNNQVIPRLVMEDGRPVVEARVLTAEEKAEAALKAVGYKTQFQGELDHQNKVYEKQQEELYHERLGSIRRQYGNAGVNVDIGALRHDLNLDRRLFRAEDFAKLHDELNTLDKVIKTSVDSHTDQPTFMGLWYRIKQGGDVDHTELVYAGLDKKLNSTDFRFLADQLDTSQQREKTAFDKQYNTMIKAIGGLFDATDSRTVLGDKISEYEFYVRAKADELLAVMDPALRKDSQQANLIVAQAAAEVIPAAIARDPSASAGLEKSRFGRFFTVLGGGDWETAEHILATTPNLTAAHRANLRLAIAGQKAVLGIMERVQSGQASPQSFQRNPSQVVPTGKDIQIPAVPKIGSVGTVLKEYQSRVDRLEQQRLKNVEDIKRANDELRKLKEQKANGPQ